MNIGFIGLGIMGKPMAKNLTKKGYHLTIYDIVEDDSELELVAGIFKELLDDIDLY